MNFKKFALKIVRNIISMTIKFEDVDFDNILIDAKSHKNILIYDSSYKTLIGPKPLRIRYDKIDGFIRIYDGNRYLVLFGTENMMLFKSSRLVSLESSIRYVFPHYYLKIRADSYDSLPIEKTLTLHNIIILIKSVLNKDQNHYCYNIFLRKYSYQLAKK